MQNENYERGFIKYIILFVIAIIILSYLGFDIKKIFTSPTTINNFSYVWGIVKNIWVNYLSVPFTFIWSEAIRPVLSILWNVFKAGLANMQVSGK